MDPVYSGSAPGLRYGSSMGSMPGQSSSFQKGTIAVVIVALVLFFIALGTLQWSNNKQDDKRNRRRKSVERAGDRANTLYDDMDNDNRRGEYTESPLRSSDSMYRAGYYLEPAGGPEMKDAGPIKAADNPLETDNEYDPYEDYHETHPGVHTRPSHLSHDGGDDDDDDDDDEDDDDEDDDDDDENDSAEEDSENDEESQVNNAQENDDQADNNSQNDDADIPTRVSSERIPGLYADKIKPDDPTPPGIKQSHVAFAQSHGKDPKDVDPYKHQSVAVTGMEYLDPANMNYVGPSNKWGLEPKKNVSVFDVPKEFGGSGEHAENIMPTKKKKRTPQEQLNRHRSVIHREMEKNKDKMMDKLRSTVEDIPPEERTQHQEHIHNLDWEDVQKRALGTPSLQFRAYMHDNVEGGHGLTKYFENMSSYEQRRKMDHLVRTMAYTALRYDKTNLVDLLHAMRLNLDNPLHYYTAKNTLNSIKTTHDVSDNGQWIPKAGYDQDDMETAVGRVLPYGRIRNT